jgi:oxygen-independent coproporphyrinogen-3 oxidase
MRADLIACMADEIRLQHAYLGDETISTVYFGGGTPSLLTPQEIGLLFEALRQSFTISADAEITLEANPDDLDLARLNELRTLGFNRLSIGIQAFQEKILTFLNRAHDSRAARNCVHLARDAGFENISIDLIYAIPGMTEDEWRTNIEQALALEPEHISAYSLTIEEKTVFGRWAASGKLRGTDDDEAANQLETLLDLLQRAGYEQYEISNFCKPGFISRHNSNYWRGRPYLGVGPSAHSYNLISRQFNVNNNHAYVRSLRDGVIPFDIENLTLKDHINEYLLTSLRTRWGADLDQLKLKYQYDLIAVNGTLINDLMGRNLAIIENRFLKLTPAGRLMADKITTDLFLV